MPLFPSKPGHWNKIALYSRHTAYLSSAQITKTAYLFTKRILPLCFSHLSTFLFSVLAYLIKDLLTEYAYLGELAGLFYSLKPTKNGLELSVRGYSRNQVWSLSGLKVSWQVLRKT